MSKRVLLAKTKEGRKAYPTELENKMRARVVLPPAQAGSLVYPVNVTRQLALKSLSVAEFGNRKLPGNLSSSPLSSGAL